MKDDRDSLIIRTSVVGIIGNMVLVVFKLLVGFLSNSIAIILDGVNNATDALSFIVTIVATKIAGMRPTRKHPFGYGRTEYLASVAIGLIILVAGVLSMRESIVKIINPAEPSYDSLTITVIIVAIAVKIGIGIYFNRMGKKTDSGALRASAVDSNYDAVLSAGTLIVAFAQNIWGINIDGIVGAIISLAVIKAGLEVLADAISPIIGTREKKELGDEIYAYVNSFDGVLGTYDLILDDFGPRERIGSMHIEVPEDMTAKEIHKLTRNIAHGLFEKFNLNATIGIYAQNAPMTFDDFRDSLVRIAEEHPQVLQVHGFYVDVEENTIMFDMVVDFHADKEAVRSEVIEKISSEHPGYRYNVDIDTDFEG